MTDLKPCEITPNGWCREHERYGSLCSKSAPCEKCDVEMERVKACEHIAEGEPGWEKLSNVCPSAAAVAKLRRDYDESVAGADSARRKLDECGEAMVLAREEINSLKKSERRWMDAHNQLLGERTLLRAEAAKYQGGSVAGLAEIKRLKEYVSQMEISGKQLERRLRHSESDVDMQRRERSELNDACTQWRETAGKAEAEVGRLKAENKDLLYKWHGAESQYAIDTAALQARVKAMGEDQITQAYQGDRTDARLAQAMAVIDGAEKAMDIFFHHWEHGGISRDNQFHGQTAYCLGAARKAISEFRGSNG